MVVRKAFWRAAGRLQGHAHQRNIADRSLGLDFPGLAWPDRNEGHVVGQVDILRPEVDDFAGPATRLNQHVGDQLKFAPKPREGAGPENAAAHPVIWKGRDFCAGFRLEEQVAEGVGALLIADVLEVRRIEQPYTANMPVGCVGLDRAVVWPATSHAGRPVSLIGKGMLARDVAQRQVTDLLDKVADRQAFDLLPVIGLRLRLAQLVIHGNLAKVDVERLADGNGRDFDGSKKCINGKGLQFTLRPALAVQDKKAADNLLDIILADELRHRLVAETGREGGGAGLTISRLRALSFRLRASCADWLTHGRPESVVSGGELVAAKARDLRRAGPQGDTDCDTPVEASEALRDPAVIVPASTPEAEIAIRIFSHDAGQHNFRSGRKRRVVPACNPLILCAIFTGKLALVVRMRGLEPPHLAALEPKSSASTNSATSARQGLLREGFAGGNRPSSGASAPGRGGALQSPAARRGQGLPHMT